MTTETANGNRSSLKKREFTRFSIPLLRRCQDMRGKRSPACDDKGCVARDEPRLLGHQCCLHSVNSCLPWRELISQPPLSDICRMTRVFRSAGSGLPDDGELEEGEGDRK
jgi:hypothetical protein